MTVAVVGAGNVGTALAAGWHKAGHHVSFGVRDPQSDKTKKATTEVSDLSLRIEDAIATNEIIVISTPPEAVHDLVPLRTAYRSSGIHPTSVLHLH